MAVPAEAGLGDVALTIVYHFRVHARIVLNLPYDAARLVNHPPQRGVIKTFRSSPSCLFCLVGGFL